MQFRPSLRISALAGRGFVLVLAAVAVSACAHTHGSTKDARNDVVHERLSMKDTPAVAAQPLPKAERVVYAPRKMAAERKVVAVRAAPAARVVVPAPKVVAPAAVSPPAAVTPRPQPVPSQKAAPASPAPSQAESETAACGTRADCLATFRAMLADPNHAWMDKRPTPAEYATGMRLFAYRALSKKLECRRLVQAVEEITMAEAMLATYASGPHAEQARRVGALNGVVKRELMDELKARC